MKYNIIYMYADLFAFLIIKDVGVSFILLLLHGDVINFIHSQSSLICTLINEFDGFSVSSLDSWGCLYDIIFLLFLI